MKLKHLFETTTQYHLMSEDELIALAIDTPKQIPNIVKQLKANNLELSESAQIEICNRDGYSIEYIILAGITPSESVQLAACNQNGHAINCILYAEITPSERVQIAACTSRIRALEYITQAGIKPNETVQLAACTSFGRAIEYLVQAKITPSETVQLAACREDGRAVDFLIKAGIPPSEDVQIAACSQNGWALQDIIKSGMPISDTVYHAAFITIFKEPNNRLWHKIITILKSSDEFELPIQIQQKILKKYPELLLKFPHRFIDILQLLVDNLRSALETHNYSLDDIHKFIDIVYHDDPDMIATLKHRANAIQRKLDQRNK